MDQFIQKLAPGDVKFAWQPQGLQPTVPPNFQERCERAYQEKRDHTVYYESDDFCIVTNCTEDIGSG